MARENVPEENSSSNTNTTGESLHQNDLKRLGQEIVENAEKKEGLNEFVQHKKEDILPPCEAQVKDSCQDCRDVIRRTLSAVSERLSKSLNEHLNGLELLQKEIETCSSHQRFLNRSLSQINSNPDEIIGDVQNQIVNNTREIVHKLHEMDSVYKKLVEIFMAEPRKHNPEEEEDGDLSKEQVPSSRPSLHKPSFSRIIIQKISSRDGSQCDYQNQSDIPAADVERRRPFEDLNLRLRLQLQAVDSLEGFLTLMSRKPKPGRQARNDLTYLTPKSSSSSRRSKIGARTQRSGENKKDTTIKIIKNTPSKEEIRKHREYYAKMLKKKYEGSLWFFNPVASTISKIKPSKNKTTCETIKKTSSKKVKEVAATLANYQKMNHTRNGNGGVDLAAVKRVKYSSVTNSLRVHASTFSAMHSNEERSQLAQTQMRTNRLRCYDLLDDIVPDDVRPLSSEYPRRDLKSHEGDACHPFGGTAEDHTYLHRMMNQKDTVWKQLIQPAGAISVQKHGQKKLKSLMAFLTAPQHQFYTAVRPAQREMVVMPLNVTYDNFPTKDFEAKSEELSKFTAFKDECSDTLINLKNQLKSMERNHKAFNKEMSPVMSLAVGVPDKATSTSTIEENPLPVFNVEVRDRLWTSVGKTSLTQANVTPSKIRQQPFQRSSQPHVQQHSQKQQQVQQQPCQKQVPAQAQHHPQQSVILRKFNLEQRSKHEQQLLQVQHAHCQLYRQQQQLQQLQQKQSPRQQQCQRHSQSAQQSQLSNNSQPASAAHIMATTNVIGTNVAAKNGNNKREKAVLDHLHNLKERNETMRNTIQNTIDVVETKMIDILSSPAPNSSCEAFTAMEKHIAKVLKMITCEGDEIKAPTSKEIVQETKVERVEAEKDESGDFSTHIKEKANFRNEPLGNTKIFKKPSIGTILKTDVGDGNGKIESSAQFPIASSKSSRSNEDTAKVQGPTLSAKLTTKNKNKKRANKMANLEESDTLLDNAASVIKRIDGIYSKITPVVVKSNRTSEEKISEGKNENGSYNSVIEFFDGLQSIAQESFLPVPPLLSILPSILPSSLDNKMHNQITVIEHKWLEGVAFSFKQPDWRIVATIYFSAAISTTENTTNNDNNTVDEEEAGIMISAPPIIENPDEAILRNDLKFRFEGIENEIDSAIYVDEIGDLEWLRSRMIDSSILSQPEENKREQYEDVINIEETEKKEIRWTEWATRRKERHEFALSTFYAIFFSTIFVALSFDYTC